MDSGRGWCGKSKGVRVLCVGIMTLSPYMYTPPEKANALFLELTPDERRAYQEQIQMLPPPSPVVTQSHPAKLDFSYLRNNGVDSVMAAKRKDSQIVRQIDVEVSPTESFKVVKDDMYRISDRDFAFVGHIHGSEDQSRAFFVVRDDLAITGTIRVAERAFDISPPVGSIFIVREEVNSKAYPPERPPQPWPPESGTELSGSVTARSEARRDAFMGSAGGSAEENVRTMMPCPTDGRPVIDVMVLYTPSVEKASNNNIDKEIELAVDEANSSFKASGVNLRIRAVHAARVNYEEEGGDLTNDLNFVQSDAAVARVRRRYHADLVSLWVTKGEWCGFGRLMRTKDEGFRTAAFSVVRYDCARINYSFVHELGHNMGADHDRYEVAQRGGGKSGHESKT